MCGGKKFNSFQVDCLDAHNDYRSRHGSPPMDLNQHLCRYAEDHAKYLCQCGAAKLSKGPYGENIFIKQSKRKVYPDAMEPVMQWYSEGATHGDIDYPSKEIKHFSQVVWKGSRSMGVGYAMSPDNKKIIVVANYFPPGNDFDTFAENVKPMKSEKKDCPSKIKLV